MGEFLSWNSGETQMKLRKRNLFENSKIRGRFIEFCDSKISLIISKNATLPRMLQCCFEKGN